jgi:hypothetical protein
MNMQWAPLIMVGGFLSFGVIFVLVSDIGDWLSEGVSRHV